MHTSLTLRTDFGWTEAVVDEDGGLKRFYEVINILSQNPQVKFSTKLDDFDSIYWDFFYKKNALTLHYNIYTGVTLYPQKFAQAAKKENEAVVEVAGFLETELLVNTSKKYLS
ncbi:MAG: hypothetical protein INR73_20560 [Williamsia sp.]|nr:hypothetical protein [Williamsia sp.]